MEWSRESYHLEWQTARLLSKWYRNEWLMETSSKFFKTAQQKKYERRWHNKASLPELIIMHDCTRIDSLVSCPWIKKCCNISSSEKKIPFYTPIYRSGSLLLSSLFSMLPSVSPDEIVAFPNNRIPFRIRYDSVFACVLTQLDAFTDEMDVVLVVILILIDGLYNLWQVAFGSKHVYLC